MMKQDYGHIIIDAQTKEKCNGDYIPAGDSGEEVIEAWLSNSLQYCQRHEMDGRTGKMNAYCKAGSKIRGGGIISGDGSCREPWQEIAYRRIKAYNYDVNEHWGEKMG